MPKTITKSVLVVDDEPAVCTLLEVVLGEAGYGVERAEDGEQALEHVRESPPDVCVLDVMMPRVDGWEVLRSVRANPATADLPVVMLTAKGDPQDRLRGWKLGCDAYVPKPFDPSDLVREVTAVLVRDPSERIAQRERQRIAVQAIVDGGGKLN